MMMMMIMIIIIIIIIIYRLFPPKKHCFSVRVILFRHSSFSLAGPSGREF